MFWAVLLSLGGKERLILDDSGIRHFLKTDNNSAMRSIGISKYRLFGSLPKWLERINSVRSYLNPFSRTILYYLALLKKCSTQ